MFTGVNLFALLATGDFFVIGGLAVAILAVGAASLVLFHYGALWLQAYASGADVHMTSLIGMSLRRVNASMTVTAKIMARQGSISAMTAV